MLLKIVTRAPAWGMSPHSVASAAVWRQKQETLVVYLYITGASGDLYVDADAGRIHAQRCAGHSRKSNKRWPKLASQMSSYSFNTPVAALQDHPAEVGMSKPIAY